MATRTYMPIYAFMFRNVGRRKRKYINKHLNYAIHVILIFICSHTSHTRQHANSQTQTSICLYVGENYLIYRVFFFLKSG